MGWDYRIVRKQYRVGKSTHVTYGIHEVYYDSKKPHSVTESSIDVYGDTPVQLLHSWMLMAEAFTKPILDYSSFDGKDVEGITIEELTSLKDVTFDHDDSTSSLSKKDYDRHGREMEKDRILSEIIYERECEDKGVDEVLKFAAALVADYRKRSKHREQPP